MNRITISLCLLLTAYILISCAKEDKEYYSSLGIINITNDSIIIDSDKGNRLLVENHNSIGNSIIDKDRVMVTYSVVNQTLPTGIDFIIDIYSIEKVLFKPVIELTIENADSIGNDELTVNSLWLDIDYLNLNFLFIGGQQEHYINLIRYPGEIPVDTINLEIRHNANDDNGPYSLNGFVSFDLKSLRNDLADSVIICIKAKEFSDRIYEKFFTYKY